MMAKRKVFLLIIISFFVLTQFSMPENVEAAAKMPKGSKIANVSIDSKTENEVRQLLESEITSWQSGDDIELTSDFEQFRVPRDVFEFDIEGTIKQFNERTKRTFTSLFMRQKNVQIPLIVHINVKHEAVQSIQELDYINNEETFLHISDIAGQLEEAKASIVYIEGKEIPLDTIAETEIKIPKLSDAVLTYAINELNEYIIAPDDNFSFRQAVVLPEHLTNSSAELSFLATALYSLFLQTNFDIVERHPELTLPTYAEAGLDAAISEREEKDLIVINPNSISFKIEASKQEGKLKVAIKSSKSDYTYQYDIENVREIKQRTLFRYSKKLKAGEQQTIQAGSKGLKAEVHRSIYEKNVYLDSELISQDVYLPVPKIVLVSTSEDIPEEDLAESPEEVLDEVTDLEQMIKDLDEQLNIFPTDPESPTFSEQLQKIRQAQADLEKRIAQIETEFDTSSVTLDEELNKFKNETEQRLDKLNAQLEKLLIHFLNEPATELGKETKK